MPLDSESPAINILETTAYFQGKRMVDDYLDQFRDLIYNSGYTDPKTVVVKFRRGLDRRILTALAGMTYRRPSDTDREAWFRLAVQVYQNQQMRRSTSLTDNPMSRLDIGKLHCTVRTVYRTGTVYPSYTVR